MITVRVYDLARFSASVVMDILRTHPQVIVGGILRENHSAGQRAPNTTLSKRCSGFGRPVNSNVSKP
jgi:hypothetical protein